MMVRIIPDKTGRLTQWDVDRKILISGIDLDGAEVHFASPGDDHGAYVVNPKDNAADIPNILLTVAGTINVYIYPKNYTVFSAVLIVTPREKPDDYVYTETETIRYSTLAKQIGDLDGLTTTAKENLVAAINEAAATAGGGKIDKITVNGTEQNVEDKTAKIVVDKSTVGLGNVDNTADVDKPVSTAVQAELDKKAPKETAEEALEVANGATDAIVAVRETAETALERATNALPKSDVVAPSSTATTGQAADAKDTYGRIHSTREAIDNYVSKLTNDISAVEQTANTALAKQSDWSQNDATANDYIKNRPGGYVTGTFEPFEITWDGVIGDKTTFENDYGAKFVKISDRVLTKEELIDALVTTTDKIGDNAYTANRYVDRDSIYEVTNALTAGGNPICVSAVPATVDGMTFTETGTYLRYYDGDPGVVQYTSSIKQETGGEFITKIPQKFLILDNLDFIGSFSQNRAYRSDIGTNSHAEGSSATASGQNSHAEGSSTQAIGFSSHAEGFYTKARSSGAHAEGSYADASGSASHAEGNRTQANGNSSHAEGNRTQANGYCQHVEGEYNTPSGIKNSKTDTDYVHIVGNGTSNTPSNAHTLTWSGIPWYQGRPQFGGTAMDNGAQTVMANGDKEITLASSTTDSAKKFAASVDDAGALSLTDETGAKKTLRAYSAGTGIQISDDGVISLALENAEGGSY